MILNQYGQPFARPPFKLPRAPWTEASYRDIWDNINPEYMAGLFRQADFGDLSAIDELCTVLSQIDAQVECESPKRTNGILQLDEQLSPASKSEEDNLICDYVREKILDHPQWSDTLCALNRAWLTGQAAVELVWDPIQKTIREFRRLQLGRLSYIGDDGLLADYPRLITDESPLGIEINPLNICLHTKNSLISHPVRLGAYRALAMMVMYKYYSLKDWAAFLERYGIPIRLGRYDVSTSENDRATLYEAVRMLGSDGAAIISKDTEIEILDVASAPAQNKQPFELQILYADSAISKIITGVTLATEIQGNGSRSAAETQDSAFLRNLVAPDGERVAQTILQQIIKPLVRFKFGENAPLPFYSLHLKKGEDYEVNSKVFNENYDKVPFSLSEVYEKIGWHQPEIDEDVIGGSVGQSVSQAKIMAKRSAREREVDQLNEEIDDMALNTADYAASDFRQNMAKFVKLAKEAGSYEELLLKLQEVASGLSNSRSRNALRAGMIAAMMKGMQQVQGYKKNG